MDLVDDFFVCVTIRAEIEVEVGCHVRVERAPLARRSAPPSPSGRGKPCPRMMDDWQRTHHRFECAVYFTRTVTVFE
jgi:hypothetical protein